MSLKFLFLGRLYLVYRKYDKALGIFDNSDYLSNDIIYKDPAFPPDFYSVFEYLEKQGLIAFERKGIRITESGKNKIKSGGFSRQLLKERIIYFGIIVGIISGIITIISCFFSYIVSKLFPLF